MKKPQWEFIEAGWWTHELLGGVVRERSGWSCYPMDIHTYDPAHRARTRDGAMRWIERRYKNQKRSKGGK